MGNALQGDFGSSLRTERDIGTDLLLRFPVTIELAILGLIFAMAISLPLGVIAAVKRNTWVDYSARSAAVFALAIPGFWLATLAVVFGAKWFGWSPPLGFEQIYDDPITNLSQMWLPALLYGLILAGVQTRILRTALLEVLRQDYIRTARAKGLTGRLVITRHALRNSLIPYITILGVQFPVILGGAVVFEVIFSLPGVATFLIDAINNRDFTVVQAVNVWLAALVIGITLAVDLSYAFIDPRIRLS
jgi:peptide/nickel transport system permease protein